MFSLIRPAKVEGHGVSAGHIHHSQGGKLLQLLRDEGAGGIPEVREAEETPSPPESPSEPATARGAESRWKRWVCLLTAGSAGWDW